MSINLKKKIPEPEPEPESERERARGHSKRSPGTQPPQPDLRELWNKFLSGKREKMRLAPDGDYVDIYDTTFATTVVASEPLEKQVRDIVVDNYDKVINKVINNTVREGELTERVEHDGGFYSNNIRLEMSSLPRGDGNEAYGSLIILSNILSQDLAFILTEALKQKKMSAPKLSIQVAGNALRPGGACGGYYGKNIYVSQDGTPNPDAKPPYHYNTQEESIMDSMIHGYKIDVLDKDIATQEHVKARPLYNEYFAVKIGDKADLNGIYPVSACDHIKKHYSGGIGRPWGPAADTETVALEMYPPHDWKPGQTGASSIQGHDFTEPFYCIDNQPVETVETVEPVETELILKKRVEYHAKKYNFAYTVPNIQIALSAKCYRHENRGQTDLGLEIAADGSSITRGVDLVYVYGPNAFYSSFGDPGVEREDRTLLGTGTRSLIAGYREHPDYDLVKSVNHVNANKTDPTDDYEIFKGCVTMAFRATLTTMKDKGVEYPILCYVSGGIYGGVYGGATPFTSVTGRRIRDDTPSIIAGLNRELETPFKNIYLCDAS